MPWLLQINTTLTAENCLWRYPGIPEIKIFGVLESVLGDTTYKFEGVPQVHPDIIGSVRIDANESEQVYSDAELFVTPGSFFYDYDGGAIHLNLAKYDNGVAVEGYQSPIGKRVAIGIIVGYCDTVDYSRDDKSTYSGIFHDPRIKALPTLASKMDDLDYGFQAFNDWSVSLIGVDGEFEGIDRTGCIAKLIWLPEGGELADGKTSASGRIMKAADGDDYTLSVGDIRRNGENIASCGRFSKDDFPYLDKEDAGKIIPMYWNKQTGIEPVCINKTEDLSESPASLVKYCIGATPDSAHAIKRVDRVYMSGSSGSYEILPGFSFGSAINTGIRRSDRLPTTVSAVASPSGKISSGFSFGTEYATGLAASAIVMVRGTKSGALASGTDYTLIGPSPCSIKLICSTALPDNSQDIIIEAASVDMTQGTDFTVSSDDDGFAIVTINCTAKVPSASSTVTISADSDDNSDADIEAPISTWEATLIDTDLGIAYIGIPAGIAYDGDAPIGIKVDLFGWNNQTAGETEWMNGADIVRDAIVRFMGYRYEPVNFDMQSWEVERVKCADKGIHVSPRIEDDTTINDLIGQVAKSCLMLVTNRADGRFDLKVDSMDVYPQWKIDAYQRMETPAPSIDLAQAFSSIKIKYGTSGDTDKKTYIDTTHETNITAINAISKAKEIDTIISDEESAKQYAAMVYERVFDLESFKVRDLIEIKVPAETYLLDIWPSKSFIAPRTRDGSLFAAYTVISASRALGDELITITGRKRYNIEFDTEYTQGVICDDFICDGAVIGATTIEAA